MQTRRPATLGVSVTIFILGSIFVALRFVSRIFVVKKIGLHDWLMLLAWVCEDWLALRLPGMATRTWKAKWEHSQLSFWNP